MPNNISILSAIEKNRLSSDVAFIALLEIEMIDPVTRTLVETAYIARNPTPFTFRSIVYEAGSFDIELKSESGTQPTVALTVQDMTRGVQAKMQAFGGGIGFNVKVMIVSEANPAGEPEVSEYFQVVGANAQGYTASFILGAENALTVSFPRRRQTKNFCGWRYKNPLTCRYTGGLATCDLTLQGPNGCATHNNTVNFGAYPGLNRNGVRYA